VGGHLKPLGKPGQKARKWYATIQFALLGHEPVWPGDWLGGPAGA